MPHHENQRGGRAGHIRRGLAEVADAAVHAGVHGDRTLEGCRAHLGDADVEQRLDGVRGAGLDPFRTGSGSDGAPARGEGDQALAGCAGEQGAVGRAARRCAAPSRAVARANRAA